MVVWHAGACHAHLSDLVCLCPMPSRLRHAMLRHVVAYVAGLALGGQFTLGWNARYAIMPGYLWDLGHTAGLS